MVIATMDIVTSTQKKREMRMKMDMLQKERVRESTGISTVPAMRIIVI